MGRLWNVAGWAVTAPARCVCCDLPVASCGLARERAAVAAELAERRRLLARPGVVGAQFAGLCASCGERFGIGAPIVRHHGQWNAWRSLLCCEVSQ